jgi:D-alanyl-D-alanine dipeptidase
MNRIDTPLERTLLAANVATSGQFERLSTIEGVGVDLRYASPRNLAGRDLYAPHDCAWLHKDAAIALQRCVKQLATDAPGWRLLILDALRPQHVQEQLWALLDGSGLEQYLAPPSRGSIHSFGMAVDVTLQDAAGTECDMGTPFDDMSEASHPAFETRLLEAGRLTSLHIANRTRLRSAMAAGGFNGISTEWWHFDLGDRRTVRETYFRVL